MKIDVFKKTESKQLTKNFSLDELKCKCENCKHVLVCIDVVNLLQQFRENVGKPVVITSFYRCWSHNFKIGGKPDSMHLLGLAADVTIPGDNIIKYKNWFVMNFKGVGVYADRGFIHSDLRPGERVFWT